MGRTERARDIWKSAGTANRPPRGTPGSATSGSYRWFLAAFLAVGLIGAILGLLIYLWPVEDPIVLAIPVTTYDQIEWPPNPWAENDARGFLAMPVGDAALAFQAQEKQAILGELNRVATAAGNRPIVIYLSTLGLTANGQPYLLPSKAKLTDPTTWLSLEEIFTPLRSTQAPKLLILDVRPVRDLRGLQSAEDVNAVLDQFLAKSELPCQVLTANTPAAGANVLRPIGRTAFGLALAQGAGGAADGWNPKRKRNGRVSVRELAHYTRTLTHFAATAAGLPPQFPRLHGTGTDFDIVRVASTGPSPMPDLLEPRPIPEWLSRAWSERDQWFQDQLHRRAPRMVRQLTVLATRAEQQWLAGVAPSTIEKPFVAAFHTRTQALASLSAIVPPVRSVARARTFVNTAEVEKHFDELFRLISNPPAKDPDKVIEAAIIKLAPKTIDPDPSDRAAVVLFDFARNLENPTHQQMRYLASIVEHFWPGNTHVRTPLPHHAELITLQLIGKFPANLVERWEPRVGFTIKTLLKAAQAAEEITAYDARCQPWVTSRLEKADSVHRQAIATLFDPNSLRAAREEALAQLVQIIPEYNSLAGLAREFERAVNEYEETRAVLVDLATAFPYEEPLNPKVVADGWTNLVENVHRLQKLLHDPARTPPVTTLRAATESLAASRGQLLNLLRISDFRGIRQLEVALRWPHWSLQQRQELHQKLQDTERKVTAQLLQEWLREPSEREFAEPTTSDTLMEAKMMHQIRRWIDLLRLAGCPGMENLISQADRLQIAPSGDAVAQLAAQIRRVSRTGFKQAYDTMTGAERAACGWMVDVDELSAFGDFERRVAENPEQAERRRLEREFHLWLARTRYQAAADRWQAVSHPAIQTAAAATAAIGKAYSVAFPELP
jgi:hypothetical protein